MKAIELIRAHTVCYSNVNEINFVSYLVGKNLFVIIM